jgi:hypothetical protein
MSLKCKASNAEIEWRDECGNSPYSFTMNEDFENYKNMYPIEYLKEVEDDDSKIDAFYKLVLPSLSCKFKDKWACLFDPCCQKRFTYASKQTYFRHIQIFHKKLIPGGGLFLTPNSTYFSRHRCKYCGSSFGRKDKLDHHLKNTKACSKKHLADSKNVEIDPSILVTPETSIENTSISKNAEPSLEETTTIKSTSNSEREGLASSEILDSDEIPCGQPVKFISIVQVPNTPDLSEEEDCNEIFVAKPIQKSTPKRALSSFSINGDDLKKNKDEDKENNFFNEEDEDDKLLLEFLSNSKY